MERLGHILVRLVQWFLVLAIAAIALVEYMTWFPKQQMEAMSQCAAMAPSVPRDTPLRVVVWNIQYGAGRTQKFYYDGGEAVMVPPAEVEATLTGVIDTLRALKPDLVILQEVDRDSRRTGRVDEHERIAAALGLSCTTTTPYHKVGYLPHPSHQHSGRVEMHLAVLSRYRIDRAVRHQLAALDEPLWRQAFNLRRAVLEVRMPIQGGGELRVLDTHLSAFSRGDGTLAKQMGQLDKRMTEAEEAGGTWVLAGDLNALPVGDDPARLGDDAQYYADAETPVGRLFGSFRSVVPAAAYLEDPQRWRTYVPFGADAADRTLDYAFVGSEMTAGEPRVVDEAIRWSDHLPFTFTLQVGRPAEDEVPEEAMAPEGEEVPEEGLADEPPHG